MGKNHPCYAKSVSTNFPASPHTMGFVAFSRAMENWWGNLCISQMLKYTIKWESYGKNHPYNGKSVSMNFPGSPHMMGFVAFSRTMKNWWGNPCISQMMKYTIKWKSYGEKAPILWEKYEYRFPRLSPYHGFCISNGFCNHPCISHMTTWLNFSCVNFFQ